MTERQKERNTKRHKDKKAKGQNDDDKNWYYDVRKMTEICQKDDRMSELLTDWVTDFNGKTAPPWRRQPVPKEDKISNWKSTSLFRKTTPPCGIQPLHLEDNRIQLCDVEALLMIYQFQFINIKRYTDLRWLFDDWCCIHDLVYQKSYHMISFCAAL